MTTEIEQIAKPKKLDSPYSSNEEEERLHIFVGKSDVTFIRLLRPQNGTLTFVGAHLWKALCTALRNRSILDHTDVESFEHFINNITVISKDEYEQLKKDSNTTSPPTPTNYTVSGRPTLRHVSNADGQDAGVGSEAVPRPHPGGEKERGNVQKRGGKKGSGERGERSKVE